MIMMHSPNDKPLSFDRNEESKVEGVMFDDDDEEQQQDGGHLQQQGAVNETISKPRYEHTMTTNTTRRTSSTRATTPPAATATTDDPSKPTTNTGNPTASGITNEQLLCIAFITFCTFAITQFVYAFIAESQAMKGDSAAMLIDSLTYLFNFIAERLKRKHDPCNSNGITSNGNNVDDDLTPSSLAVLQQQTKSHFPTILKDTFHWMISSSSKKQQRKQQQRQQKQQPQQQQQQQDVAVDRSSQEENGRTPDDDDNIVERNGNAEEVDDDDDDATGVQRVEDATGVQRVEDCHCDCDCTTNNENAQQPVASPPPCDHSRQKRLLQLEIIPPLLSVTTLLAITIIILNKSVRVLYEELNPPVVEDSNEIVDTPAVPNMKIMLIFSSVNLFLDIVNVFFFAKAKHLFGYTLVTGNNDEDDDDDDDNNCCTGTGTDDNQVEQGNNNNTTKMKRTNNNNNRGFHNHSHHNHYSSSSNNNNNNSNLNMCSAYTHVVADTLRSLAVIIAAGIVLVFHPPNISPAKADSVAAIIVSALILGSLLPLFRGLYCSIQEYNTIILHEKVCY